MVFGLFKKHCPICGVDVEGDKAVVCFDKYLCSQEHAEEYRQQLAQEQSKVSSKGGGCCG